MAYLDELGWPDLARAAAQRSPSWNLPPGTAPWLMHRLDDGPGRIDQVNWGYRPSWAEQKGLPIAINARLEKAPSGAFFRSLWKHGRTLVPADGWYEWSGEQGHKQPWYIRLRTDQPMLLAAITNYRPHQEPGANDGFVIVTAPAEGALLEVHDRRPVVFSPADAALWLDNSLPAQQAEQLARAMTLPADAFDCYRVSSEVNRASNDDPHLIAPV